MRKGRRKFHIEKKNQSNIDGISERQRRKNVRQTYWWNNIFGNELNERTKSLLHLFIDSQVMEHTIFPQRTIKTETKL